MVAVTLITTLPVITKSFLALLDAAGGWACGGTAVQQPNSMAWCARLRVTGWLSRARVRQGRRAHIA